MTVKQYISKLEGEIKGIKAKKDKAIRKAAAISLTHTVQRIFDFGLDANGMPIGQYSTKPMLVGAKSFRNKSGANKIFGSKSKRKAAKWVTLSKGGKNYKLVVLPGGYKAVREASGLWTGFVNLDFTGRLQSDFRSSLTKSSAGYQAGTKYARNSAITEAQEEKWGKKIFAASPGEKGIYRSEFLKAMRTND